MIDWLLLIIKKILTPTRCFITLQAWQNEFIRSERIIPNRMLLWVLSNCVSLWNDILLDDTYSFNNKIWTWEWENKFFVIGQHDFFNKVLNIFYIKNRVLGSTNYLSYSFIRRSAWTITVVSITMFDLIWFLWHCIVEERKRS
jgi:hypothetical protein